MIYVIFLIKQKQHMNVRICIYINIWNHFKQYLNSYIHNHHPNMQQQLKELMTKKDSMEKEISTLTIEIDQIDKYKSFNKGVVDHQGFPRADIDFGELASYRNIKRRRNQLNNDHLVLMKQIQSKLFLLHATFPKMQQPQQIHQDQNSHIFKKIKERQTSKKIQGPKEQKQPQKSKIDYLTPFAKISLVQPYSPAQKGGIKVGDLLSQFAQVMIYTPDNIKQIPKFVKENLQIKIVLMRPIQQDQIKANKYQKVFVLKDQQSYAKLQLTILPAKWDGRGLLGCKIDPIQ